MKVIQLSDTHLFANDEIEIFGSKSNIKFVEVVNKIIDEDIIDTDMMFLTGDVSQDKTPESYEKVIHYISSLDIPVYWIPGNHDDLNTMQIVFQNAKSFFSKSTFSFSSWQVIFLNTTINGRDDGFLSQTELAICQDAVKALSPDKKMAIVMHHHPALVGTPLIDNYVLKNAQDFWDIVTGTTVQLIICGHVHGDYRFKHNDIMIESAPATCFQWVKGTKDLTIDKRIGYKIYHFEQDYYRAVAKMW